MVSSTQVVLENMEDLCNATVNFPGLLSQAERENLITRPEKETILRRYSCLHDKLTTFFLLASAKSGADKLTRILELTNNKECASIIRGNGKNTYTGGVMKNEHEEKILENLDRLCSHTVNVPLVFTFSMGLGLISGRDKEILEDKYGSEREQLAALFTMVTKKGALAYDKLIQVLRMTQNFWTLELLLTHDEFVKDER